VQTTVVADRDIFYHYGIRALPSLVLADAAGKEISRLTPGVKNAEDILRLINTIPGS
jgi:thioredoxin-related protein